MHVLQRTVSLYVEWPSADLHQLYSIPHAVWTTIPPATRAKAPTPN